MVEPIVQTESGVNLQAAIAVLKTVTNNVEVVRSIESPNSLQLVPAREAIRDGNGGVFCGHCLAARRTWNLGNHPLCGR